MEIVIGAFALCGGQAVLIKLYLIAFPKIKAKRALKNSR